jgi:uncharacterized protein involved in tolerance to divalent cations
MRQQDSQPNVIRRIGSDFAERFWSKVEISPEGNSCWVWHGQIAQTNGYGVTWKDGKHHYAHRVAYELEHSEISTGMRVCHSCDNPPCCRPSHLFLGTQEENIQDMRRKGRNPHPLKLTEHDVLEIRRRYENRNVAKVTMQQLADEYGVYKGHISKIIHAQKWRHI